MTPRQLILMALLPTSLALLPATAPIAPVVPLLLKITPAVRQRVIESQIVDVPAALRQRNWTSGWGQGSCVHATLINLLRWQGQKQLAASWANAYSGGEGPDGLSDKAASNGLKLVQTQNGDVSFLEWAVRTRRGAGVTVQNASHMVALVGLDAKEALILDPNAPESIQHWARDRFLNEWRSGRGGGWAVTPIAGSPLPPKPWIVSKGT